MPRPTGTVTFVFTDMEGSTLLLAGHPDLYPAVVRRQREIIVEEAERRGGTFVGHEGDSCFLAFADATSAVQSMLEAQGRLRRETWPDPLEPEVRMGIHTGEAEISEDDYFGLAVHTAARVADAAHGGQILVSETTKAASLPNGYETRELGFHRLKDISEPLRLHQLTAPGLPDDFPPPRALPTAGSLRTPSTSFVGRERETAEVAGLLDSARILTLLGPGGIGKTRLALRVGAQLIDRFPDGVWFADLTGVDDPDSVADVIAEAVGVSLRTGGDPIPVIADVLISARALLIVDNFEHVIAAAPVISRLVEATSELRMLVTSRERLRLGEEKVFEVEPFAIHPDGSAVRLFVERARTVRPDFEPSPADIDAIVRICRRLDGLPLAIELAAARARLLEPEEIAERLNRHAMTLGGGARDLHPRQQTIRSTIEWSYQLLDPEEKALLSKLAVFAGPARVGAIDAVLSDHAGGLTDTLAGLIDKSLAHQRSDAAGWTRVRMLELVREYAEELLQERDDRMALSGRHASYFSRLAETEGRSMLTNQPEAAMKRIDADFAEIVRAFDWSIEHEPGQAAALLGSMAFYFHSTGLAHTARRWEERTRDIDVPLETAARRSIAAGYVAFGFRELEKARVHWEQAIPAFRRTGDHLHEGWATMSLGATFIGHPEDHVAALGLVERGIELAQEAESPVLVALGYNIVGELARVHGDDDTADAAYLAGAEIARAIDDHYRMATMLGNRVYTATHRGDLDLALELGRSARDLHRMHGHRNQLPWVSVAMCGALVRQGWVEEATILLGAADESARRMLFEEFPGDVAENIAIRALVRVKAGDRFDEWHERGRQTSLEEAVARVDQLTAER